MVVRVPAAAPKPSLPMRGGTIYVGHTMSFPRRRESHFTSAHKWRFRGNDAADELAMQEEYDVNTPPEGRGWVGILGSGAKS